MSDPISPSSLQRRLEADLRAITAEIERLTGIPSSWNGRVEIIPANNREVGGKTFSCLIRVRADIVEEELRWPTLLHEAFHGFSVGRNADASVNFPGYEEGVVEQLQRLFRDELLIHLGVAFTPETFVDRDRNSSYNDYIEALEAIREALEAEPNSFLIELLRTPLEERSAVLREQAQNHPLWRNAGFRRRRRQWERILYGKGI